MRFLFRLKAIVAAMLATGAAFAEPSATDRTLAQSLFDEGKELMAAGRYAEACAKLDESQRRDPSGGTILNLALCREREGRIATAWADFKEALSLARRDGRSDRVQAAQDHLAALQSQLPFLTVTVVDPAAEQEVTLDGSPLGRAAFGVAVSVDPGNHEIRATAPGRAPWSSTVESKRAERLSILVPKLELVATTERTPAAAGEAFEEGSPPPGASTDHTLAWVLGGTGVVSIGVGSYFGLRAFERRKASDKSCPTDTTCDAGGLGEKANEQAKTSAWVANATIGGGLVLVAVSAYLLLSSPRETSQSTARAARAPAVDVQVTPNASALLLRGVW